MSYNTGDLDNESFFGLDVAFVLYHGEISLIEELSSPEIIKYWVELSKNNGIVLFSHFVAKIEDKKFLSVIVIDKGRIIGISDTVMDSTGYFPSHGQRIYMTSIGKAGVVCDNDILQAESVRSLFLNGAEFVVCMTKKKLSAKYLEALSAHGVFNKISLVAVFSDKICSFFEKNSIMDISETTEFFIYETEIPSGLDRFISPSFEY